MGDFAKLAECAETLFPIFNDVVRDNDITDEDVEYVCLELRKLGLLTDFFEIVQLELCHVVRTKIVPRFWEHFEYKSEKYDVKTAIRDNDNFILLKVFAETLQKFEVDYGTIKKYFDRLQKVQEFIVDKSLLKRYDVIEVFREALLSQLSPELSRVVYAFFYISLLLFARTKDNCSLEIDGEVCCYGCNLEIDNCRCHDLLETVKETNNRLIDIELLDRLAGSILTLLVQKRIDQHINNTCRGIFDKSHLKQLEMWLENGVLRWLADILNNPIDRDDSKTKNILEGFKLKLTYYLYEQFAHSVIEQFFSIIIDFPESIPAIDDLKICIEKIDLKNHVIKSVKNSLEAKILHPGVNTMDILTGYVAAIKTIRHLDQSGIILNAVTASIKDYLRRRTDTVRRVVTGLTEEGPTDLSEELARKDIIQSVAASDSELNGWESWQPYACGVDNYYFTQNQSCDIISMIIGIYGSKELFMCEYRNLMADRLLTALDFSLEKEIRNLELLKIRFGDTLLHSCEVMLKDVADSKRINAHIQSDPEFKDGQLFEISTLIISAQFWPTFNKESLVLPPEIENEFKNYTKSYEAYKGNRTLNWRPVTGKVNIEIELSTRTIEMTVAPTQAVILYHFQSKSEWTIDDLSNTMKVPSTILRKRMTFWLSQGLIVESRPDVFTLIDDNTQNDTLQKLNTSYMVAEEEEIESAMASANDQREEELQVFWSYIVGMLTNLDSLPLERIHQMLKLFASHGIGVEFSVDELKDFLQRKVQEHKLTFSGGVYQLNK